MVRRFRYGDKRYYDVEGSTALGHDVANNNSDITPASNTLFSPTIGNDIINRTGRKCYVTSMTFKVTVHWPIQGTQIPSDLFHAPIRLIIYSDTGNNGGNIRQAIAPLITSHISGGSLTQFQSLSTMTRYRFLKDVVLNPRFAPVTMGASDNNGAVYLKSPQVRYFKIRVRLRRPMVVTFNSGNTGDASDIVDNCLKVGAVYERVGTNVSAPTVFYICRTYFREYLYIICLIFINLAQVKEQQ